MTATYKNPQTVYISKSYGLDNVATGQLLRRTPSGQSLVRVGEREIRFDKEGYEMGGSRYNRDRLIDQETYQGIVARRERRLRSVEIQKGLKKLAETGFNYYGECNKESMVEELTKLLTLAQNL